MEPVEENKDNISVVPINLNISFSEYFRVKFEAIRKGISMSEYVKSILSEESSINLDKDTLELFRKLSYFYDDLDYSIIWGGDGFWQIKEK